MHHAEVMEVLNVVYAPLEAVGVELVACVLKERATAVVIAVQVLRFLTQRIQRCASSSVELFVHTELIS